MSTAPSVRQGNAVVSVTVNTMARKTHRGNQHWARQSAQQRGFRSGLEASNADILDGLSVSYGFETEKINYTKPASNHTYTPDFVIKTRSGKKIYVETKGRFLYDDAKKHLLVKEQHPDLDIRFVFSSLNGKVGASKIMTCAKWCEKHGYLYAHKAIPDAWINE